MGSVIVRMGLVVVRMGSTGVRMGSAEVTEDSIYANYYDRAGYGSVNKTYLDAMERLRK